MNYRWFLLASSICSLVHTVAGEPQGDSSLGLSTQLTLQDYFLIFVGGILLLNLVLIIWRTISRQAPQKEQSKVVTALGSFLSIFFVGIGSLAVFIAILATLAAVFQVGLFDWILYIIVHNVGSVVVGILGLGVVGGGLFLLGAYNLFLLQGTPFWKSLETPITVGSPQKKVREGDYWGARQTLKVLRKDSNLPAANVRVMVSDRMERKLFSRFTNTEGEAVFDGFKGHFSDYYAYVEGDENRVQYRVILMGRGGPDR